MKYLLAALFFVASASIGAPAHSAEYFTAQLKIRIRCQ